MNVEQIPVTNGPHVPTPLGRLLVNASLVSLVTVPTAKVNNTLTFSNSLMIRLLILLLSYFYPTLFYFHHPECHSIKYIRNINNPNFIWEKIQ